jgi:hypothetical protein
MVEETPIRVTLPACGTVVAVERSATVIAARQDTLCDANDLMNVRLVASAVSALLVASEPTSRGHPVNKLIDPSATVAPQKRKIAEMRTYQNRVSTSPRIKYARDLHGTKGSYGVPSAYVCPDGRDRCRVVGWCARCAC